MFFLLDLRVGIRVLNVLTTSFPTRRSSELRSPQGARENSSSSGPAAAAERRGWGELCGYLNRSLKAASVPADHVPQFIGPVNSSGSSRAFSHLIDQCRCGPVARPVIPFQPITCPCFT